MKKKQKKKTERIFLFIFYSLKVFTIIYSDIPKKYSVFKHIWLAV